MNILYIALSTIKRNFRDKRSMFRSILMPILMIMVLGTALNSAFEGQKLDKFDVCYLNQDSGSLGKEFSRFLNYDDIKSILNIREVATVEEGQKLIENRKAVSLIVVPKGYSDKLMLGENASIKIYNTKYTDFKNEIVQNIVDAYNSAGNAMLAAAKLSPKELSYTRYSTVNEIIISIEGKAPRAIDYYGVAMLVLAIMSSAAFAADMVSEDYFEDVGVRIKAAPVKPFERLIGKIIGCVVDIFIKGTIIIAFSKLVYHVYWGSNYGMIALILISAALFATIFGMFITMAVGSGNRAAGILNLVNNIFTFVAGGYALIVTTDVQESAMMHLSPNFYPMTALLNVIYSNNYKVNVHFFNTSGYISMLWVLSALMCMGFIALERRLKS
ncbi:ABC transporter permease [Candidatus Clostridium stratigraminis]|uniref:ABC transporter permease n=1 Tax=Candidatus Clostridium stratigraminis TaxID=3381661 RepID=A0ABW8T2M9_9CLOT